MLQLLPARRGVGRFLGVIVALCVAAPSAARADYKISAGDTLGIAVAGLPDLTSKVSVDIDGAAPIPLVGQMQVAGLSVAEALAKVRAALPSKEYRRRTEDGREFPVIITADEVSLSVTEYRPVYLNGDVAHPGSQAYRPGLTVRQAIALAGGFDVLRFKMDNPFLQLSDLTSEYNALWIEYAKRQVLVARLHAEVDGRDAIDTSGLVLTPIAAGLGQEIIQNERDQLAARNADFDKEQAYLQGAASKEGDRAKILSEQQSKEQTGVSSDTEDLQRYTDLFKKGAVALPLLADARRTVLLSSTRALQTTAVLNSVEREQQELSRKLTRVGDERRMKLLQDLQDANTLLATTRARLQAVSDKLRYTGMVKSQLVRGDDSRPKVAVIRIADGRRTELTADVDTELQPGDTVEIALQMGEPLAPTQ